MPETPATSRALSEIGHLFLSSVRERQMEGTQLPRRYPPGTRAAAVSVELPAAVVDCDDNGVCEQRFPQVTALLASHLSNRQSEHVHQYATHLAARGMRIGLIEMDAAMLRVTSFGPSDELDEDCSVTEKFEARTVTEALTEISWDVDRWLLVLPGGRNLEAKCLLRDVSHWVLLSTCDHDGVINCYRMLKGLNPGGEDWPRPRLSLALLAAEDAEEAERVHRKLAGVCEQFLSMPLEFEPPVNSDVPAVVSRMVTYGVEASDSSVERGGIGPQWQVMSDFLGRTKSVASHATSRPPAKPKPVPEKVAGKIQEPMQNSTRTPMPQATETMSELRQNPTAPGMRLSNARADMVSDVIDLPDGEATCESIIAAVLASESAGLMECPIAVPRCPQAKLVVSRDRRLTLLAVKGGDVTDLRPIAQAYQWMSENRKLIAMALPQLAIDSSCEPNLRLLVDRMDADSQAMHSMFYGASVSVQIYRRLRWQGRTGLLLEAA